MRTDLVFFKIFLSNKNMLFRRSRGAKIGKGVSDLRDKREQDIKDQGGYVGSLLLDSVMNILR